MHASLSNQSARCRRVVGASSARQLARKYRREQHIPNETLDFADFAVKLVTCAIVFQLCRIKAGQRFRFTGFLQSQARPPLEILQGFYRVKPGRLFGFTGSSKAPFFDLQGFYRVKPDPFFDLQGFYRVKPDPLLRFTGFLQSQARPPFQIYRVKQGPLFRFIEVLQQRANIYMLVTGLEVNFYILFTLS